MWESESIVRDYEFMFNILNIGLARAFWRDVMFVYVIRNDVQHIEPTFVCPRVASLQQWSARPELLVRTERRSRDGGSAPTAAQLAKSWKTDPRWKGIQRPYTPEDVVRLRGTLHIEYTLARLGAERLWEMLNSDSYVNALGAMSGNQAVQMVAAGLKAIYVSGWQVAADANNAGQMYPDQSLYPADSVPNLCRRLNNALMRADQIHHAEGKNGINWFAPLIADAEAGFGGTLNAFELMKAMIEAGAACVHFEDQLSSAKKCGHLGGKVLVPTQEAIQKLVAARLAADVLDVPTLVLARTDANSALPAHQRRRRLRQDFLHRQAHRRRLLRDSRRARFCHRARPGLRAVLRSHLVRNLGAEPEGSRALRRRHPRAVPRQDAGVQLLAFVQLEEEAGRRDHRALPAGAGRDGLQVPVHHAGRLPCAEPQHVRVGARLQRQRA